MDPFIAGLLTQGALGVICAFLGFLLIRADKRENNLESENQALRKQIFDLQELRIAVGLTTAQTIERNNTTIQSFTDRFTTLVNLVESMHREFRDQRRNM